MFTQKIRLAVKRGRNKLMSTAHTNNPSTRLIHNANILQLLRAGTRRYWIGDRDYKHIKTYRFNIEFKERLFFPSCKSRRTFHNTSSVNRNKHHEKNVEKRKVLLKPKRESKSIFTRNLPLSVTNNETLMAFFHDLGSYNIQKADYFFSSKNIVNNVPKRFEDRKGYGVIQFSSIEEAEDALNKISKLNNKNDKKMKIFARFAYDPHHDKGRKKK